MCFLTSKERLSNLSWVAEQIEAGHGCLSANLFNRQTRNMSEKKTSHSLENCDLLEVCRPPDELQLIIYLECKKQLKLSGMSFA